MGSADSTCWSLVQGAAEGRAGDKDAFCSRYGPVIRSYLTARWRLPLDDSDVEDAVQEALWQCIKPQGALTRVKAEHGSRFRAYLKGIVRNVALMFERGNARRHEEPTRDSILSAQASEERLSAIFDRSWAHMVIAESRELMLRRAQEGGDEELARVAVLERRYHEGESPSKIADAMDREVKKVYRDLERGKAEFRDALITVMATYYPEHSQQELLEECATLLRAAQAGE